MEQNEWIPTTIDTIVSFICKSSAFGMKSRRRRRRRRWNDVQTTFYQSLFRHSLKCCWYRQSAKVFDNIYGRHRFLPQHCLLLVILVCSVPFHAIHGNIFHHANKFMTIGIALHIEGTPNALSSSKAWTKRTSYFRNVSLLVHLKHCNLTVRVFVRYFGFLLVVNTFNM